MTTTLDKAIKAARALPQSAQDTLARDVMRYLEQRHQLNVELAEAEQRLQAGDGIPAETVIAQLRDQQKRYDV